MLRDFRYALRLLLQNPGFTVLALLALALGIGANTAIFSVTDALLWKPAPLPHVDRLAMVFQSRLERQGQTDNVAPANFLDWRAQNRVFEDLTAYGWGSANIVGSGGLPQQAQQFLVSANFFEALDVKPVLGRAFLPEEDQPGAGQVVMLSYQLWVRSFGADPAMLGKSIKLDGKPHTVIGVMPKDFDFPMTAELWTPLALTVQQRNQRGPGNLFVLGRLKPGISVARARTEMQGVARRLAQEHPQTNQGWTATVLPLREVLVDEWTRSYTLMLLGAVGFVLLIACANVANLQFARGSGRLREIAVRTALGASRGHLIRQLLTETVVLSLAGAGLGLLLAEWGLELIRAGMPAEVAKFIPGWKEIGIDARTLGFTMLVSLAAGVLSGLAPAFQLSQPSLNETLKEGGRGSSQGRGRQRFRSLLVVAEVALALVLLVGAGLMVKGFRRLMGEGQSFTPDRLLTFRLALNDPRYQDPQAVRAFTGQVLERLSGLPGAQSAAIATALPHSQHSSGRIFTLEGKPAARPGERLIFRLQSVSPAFFQTLGIPLRAGRGFTALDGPEAPRVALVSEALARRHWPGENPIGRRLKIGEATSPNPWISIVGIAGDVRYNVFDPREAQPIVYLPQAQMPMRWTDVALRTAGDPMALAAAVEREIRNLDREQPVYQLKSMAQLIHEEATGLRYVAVLMAIFGALALVLSSVGIYGVMAYAVTERTHEIGVRMALGARQGDVLSMIVRRGMLLTGTGLAAGLVMACGLARLLASLVFGIAATDAMTFGGIPVALGGAALAACYLPARKAARVDPVVALRHE